MRAAAVTRRAARAGHAPALLLAGLTLLALAGCTRLPWSANGVPDAMRKFALAYVQRFPAHDWKGILQDMDPGLRRGDIRQTMKRVAGLFPAGKPLDVHVVSSARKEGARGIQTGLTFQLHYPHRWLLANVVLADTGDGYMVTGVNVLPIPRPLQAVNRFTFAGKGALHYAVLALAVLVALFVVATLVVCARTRIARRKWLWLVFIALGLGRVTLDWSNGHVSFDPVQIDLLGAGYVQQSPYAPPFVFLGLPLGAMVFWVRRRRLAAEPSSGNGRGADGARDEA